MQFVDFEDKNESEALRQLRLTHKKMGRFRNNESSGGSQEFKKEFNPDFNQVKSDFINLIDITPVDATEISKCALGPDKLHHRPRIDPDIVLGVLKAHLGGV